MTDKITVVPKQLRQIAKKDLPAPDIEQQDNYPSEKEKEKKYIELHKIVRWPDAYDQDDVFRPKMDKAPSESPNVGKKEAIKSIKEEVDQFREMHHVLMKHGYETDDVKTYKHKSGDGQKVHLRSSAILDGKIYPGTPMVDVKGTRFTDHAELDAHLQKMLNKKNVREDQDVILAAFGLEAINESTFQLTEGTIDFNELHETFIDQGFDHEETEGPAGINFHTYLREDETPVHIALKDDEIMYAEKEMSDAS
jgi:hypothetical protein